MTDSRTLAIVSPLAWPPSDEVTWRIAAEARALAARGNRVSILAPARGSELLSQGRRILAAVRAGDVDAALAAPGEVLIVPLGRATLPTGAYRRVGGPIDISTALEDVLSRVPFDVVHVHEPLSPTPALSALRNARGVTAATLHRVEPVAGVAFLRPIVQRPMNRVDVWVAATEPARRTVAELFDRDAAVITPGVDTHMFAPAAEPASPPPIVVVSREPDREGVRFGLSVVRAADTAGAGTVTVLAPGHVPRRTTAAIPKALRNDVQVVADTGSESRARVFRRGGIALFTTVDDLAGSAAMEAMAAGMAVVAPRSMEADGLITHGETGIVLAPFSRDEWAKALTDLIASDERRTAIGDAAAAYAASHSWDDVAATLERAYDEAARSNPPTDRSPRRVIADLRVHASRALPPRDLVAACIARGVDVVAVISDGDLSLAEEAARVSPDEVTVIAGQQVHTADGDIVALFLSEAVAHGEPLADTVDAVEAQGGVVMIPHPVWGVAPSAAAVRALGSRVGCVEALSGPASVMRSTIGIEDARLMQSFGLRITAGSGATRVDQIGASHLRMPPFTDSGGFVAALEAAEPVQQRRGLRPTAQRVRRRAADDNT